ncbi:uncharacterized protein RBU57_012354 isoform 1-T1 [Macrochelys suwanniensis]
MNSDTIRRFNVVDLVAGPNTVEDPLGEPLLRNSSSFGVFCSRYEESRLVCAIGTKEEPGRQMKFLQLWMEDATVALGKEVRSQREISQRADRHVKQPRIPGEEVKHCPEFRLQLRTVEKELRGLEHALAKQTPMMPRDTNCAHASRPGTATEDLRSMALGCTDT